MITLTKTEGNKLQCLLCPHYCKLVAGKTGICGVRKNTGSEIELITYGILSSVATDPVEKKPLYHFYPGSNIFSIGSFGCNMRCDFCQNYQISQSVPTGPGMKISPEKIIEKALLTENNIGVAFTYNEPIMSFEYMRDVSILAGKKELKTVMVSNGFVNEEPLDEILGFIDAFNIDLKAFNNDFYRKLTGADLSPVMKSLKHIALSGKHLEITTLIIPGQNDSVKEMKLQVQWIAGELGKEVPFHLSRYFPRYKREDDSTSEECLERLSEIALEKLSYVYVGNLRSHAHQNTICPSCGTIVTRRAGYEVTLQNLDNSGKCSVCSKLIYRHLLLRQRAKLAE